MKIRSATRTDVAALVTLNDDIQRQHAEAYPDDFFYPADPDEVAKFFDGLLGRQDNEILLAEADGGEACAYLWYEVRRSGGNPFKKPINQLFVHHLFVVREWRRRGVGRSLLEHVRSIAQAEGTAEIALDTWAANASALSFFADEGFQTFRVFMRLPV
ncbi:MAG: GNAT family N-acetyltransferase [Pseudomonadota bacterium]